jgi:hypothetical protein
MPRRSYDPVKTRSALIAQARAIDGVTRDLVLTAEARELLGRIAELLGAPAAGEPAERLAAAVEALAADRAAVDVSVRRLAELVVYADDLAVATGVPVPLERQALAGAVRLLADTLAERAPGNAVEVRIPPFAAVQCVPGPRHTRGTPPNVVETDPVTWLRLACGRLAWAAAVDDALVSASGDRADISGYLPVVKPNGWVSGA